MIHYIAVEHASTTRNYELSYYRRKCQFQLKIIVHNFFFEHDNPTQEYDPSYFFVTYHLNRSIARSSRNASTNSRKQCITFFVEMCLYISIKSFPWKIPVPTKKHGPSNLCGPCQAHLQIQNINAHIHVVHACLLQ